MQARWWWCHDRFVWLLISYFLLQVAFWHSTRRDLPVIEVVPIPPSQEALKVLSFGDEQFLFRIMVFTLGNLGDTFGRNTPLYKYDMKRIYTWSSNLDTLDSKSNEIPNLAAYYFSQTQKKSDVKYMVDYLYEHSVKSPVTKWWWLVQGAYIAQHKLGDTALALEIAEPLTNAQGIPFWARQLPAFIHEDRGEFGDAMKIIETILQHSDKIPDTELRFMRHFVEERINKLDELDKNSRKHLEKIERNKQ